MFRFAIAFGVAAIAIDDYDDNDNVGDDGDDILWNEIHLSTVESSDKHILYR